MPVPAVHCHPPLFEARSASISCEKKILLSPLPVQMEILRQKRRHDHARPVVHPSLIPQLPHRRVHDRIPRHALLPALELLLARAPGQRCELRTERPVYRMRKMHENLIVEFPPDQFADERLDPLAGWCRSMCLHVAHCPVDTADGDRSDGEIRRELRCPVDPRKITLFRILSGILSQEALQAVPALLCVPPPRWTGQPRASRLLVPATSSTACMRRGPSTGRAQSSAPANHTRLYGVNTRNGVLLPVSTSCAPRNTRSGKRMKGTPTSFNARSIRASRSTPAGSVSSTAYTASAPYATAAAASSDSGSPVRRCSDVPASRSALIEVCDRVPQEPPAVCKHVVRRILRQTQQRDHRSAVLHCLPEGDIIIGPQCTTEPDDDPAIWKSIPHGQWVRCKRLCASSSIRVRSGDGREQFQCRTRIACMRRDHGADLFDTVTLRKCETEIRRAAVLCIQPGGFACLRFIPDRIQKIVRGLVRQAK